MKHLFKAAQKMNSESSNPQLETQLKEVAQLLRQSKRILFITGAGISADSGLPTYRGVGGLYEDQLTDSGYPIEEVLSGRMLQRKPELTWKYLLEIEKACRGAKPNFGHTVIANIEREIPQTWTLTQNVDGLHRQAGSKNLIEIHGSVDRIYCTNCSFKERVSDYSHLGTEPKCQRCQSWLRPEVVLFGEMLPQAEMETYYRQLELGFDVVLSVGTSSAFPYILEPVFRAEETGIPTVEINPGKTELQDFVSFPIKLGAKNALESIWKYMKEESE